MSTFRLVHRSILYYWRTHLAVVGGAGIAVSVLAGALLVGDSVPGSLRDLFLARLGATDLVVTAPIFFREQLAAELQEKAKGIEAACPIIALPGMVIHQPSGRTSSRIQVYGVDERFWRFHETSSPPRLAEREVILTAALAEELGSVPGDTILLRVGKPSDIPATSLHGRRNDTGRTIRLASRQGSGGSSLKEFSLYPQQGALRAAFVWLGRLQKDLDRQARINTILVSGSGRETDEIVESALKESLRLEDLAVKPRWLEHARAIAVESESILIDGALADATRNVAVIMDRPSASVFTYLANSMRVGDRELPYSLVTALDDTGFGKLGLGSPSTQAARPIWLNDWTARDLDAQPGDLLAMDYYIWQESGRLTTKSSEFEVAGIVALNGPARDPDWAPTYPGITETDRVADWNPPFPIDLFRIRPKDELYWERYRTTPKAFIPLRAGQELWGNRYGDLTSIRVYFSDDSEPLVPALDSFRASLRDELDPFRMGFSIYPARAEGLHASQGATDFGEYFSYFSFFLMTSSLLLTGLFFKLGVEQRLREVGLFHAVGFPPRRIRALYLLEGAALAIAGTLGGLVGAVLYGWLIVLGLKTWWVDAVGTRLLALHVSSSSLILGGLGGVIAALVAIAWVLRSIEPVTPRSLLSGTEPDATRAASPTTRTLYLGAAALLLGLALVASAAAGWMSQVAGFFGAGSLLLVALLCHQWIRLRRKEKKLLVGRSPRAVFKLGLRNASCRPGRSLLSIALIAFASFIIVAVDAFRRDNGRPASFDMKSGTGGFPLLADSLLPLFYDPNTPEGKEAFHLPDGEDSPLAGLSFVAFRVRPGDDTSCLNLYRPRNPRILAAPEELIKSGRFSFQSSLARTEAERDNPWLLLSKTGTDGAAPVIGDANSMTYVLQLKLGEEMLVNRGDGHPLRLRLVAMLADSLFQSELLMSEENFRRFFPDEEGYRFFLMDLETPKTVRVDEVTETLEQRLADFGFDVVGTQARLADFHRVENTYLSTFQSLGGLGLVLGTFGLAAVMLRNVLERRRELALLRALGFHRRHLAVMVIAENAFLLLGGALTGTGCAIVAVAPAFFSRGGSPSLPSLGLWVLAVLGSGLMSSVIAVAASIRSPLLEALRAE